MTDWNMPPGCRVSDIPGVFDEDATAEDAFEAGQEKAHTEIKDTIGYIQDYLVSALEASTREYGLDDAVAVDLAGLFNNEPQMIEARKKWTERQIKRAEANNG